MAEIHIQGGKPLHGELQISGAKNAALPILAAALLAAEGESELSSVPRLNDVTVMLELLSSLGVVIETDGENVIYLQASDLKSHEAPYALVNRMRASALIMGPLLARLGKARISLPGGCAIGSRPIDLHLKGFAALGADIVFGHGYIEASCDRLLGSNIYLDYPSVGATENILTAACLAEGLSVLENAAAEPEVVDLAEYLNSMGAKVTGAGTDRIEVEGVTSLHGAKHRIIPDRIETGTYLVAAVMAQGNITLQHTDSNHLRPVLAKLGEVGAQIEEGENALVVSSSRYLKPIDIKTLPHPGFPTDMQPQFVALLTQAFGTSVVTETVFENRFMHVPELCRMGANIKLTGRQAIVHGPSELTGAKVAATDLRAGAALVLAGLVARGETVVTEVQHIDRGYVQMTEQLGRLGAIIERIG
jgi:UDP-N-acetylglucosamine 1-carboxyvinyltransferase